MEGDYATIGLVSFLFGVFCAYWAQETSRDALLWGIFGAVFPPIAGILLLLKNHERHKRKKQGADLL